MGERAVLAPPPAPARERRFAAATAALLLLLAALVAVALVPRALDRDEADALLLAASLAGDRDALAFEADGARRDALDLDATASGTLPGRGQAYATPLLYALVQAPAVALGGAPAGRVFQLVLLGLASWLAARALARRAGETAGWLPVLLLAGTVAGALAVRLWPEPLLLALVLFAFHLAEGRQAPLRLDLPDLYPEERAEPAAASAARWATVGGLLGAVASAAPWTLPLLWPAAARVPAAGRRRGVAALLAAAAAVALGLWLLAALSRGGDGGAGAALTAAGDRAVAAVTPPPAASTLGWDLAYAFAGRHLGLLFYCGAPLVLLAALTTGGRGGGVLWAGAALSLVLLVVLRPYDLAGSPLTIGLRAFVPVLGALLFAPVRAPSRGALAAAALVAGAFLWPLWRAPHRALGDDGEPRYAAPYLAPWAPLETTQPRLPFGDRLAFGDGRLVLLGGEALGGGRVAAVPAGRWLELLVASPGELTGLWVEAGEQAGTELPARGAEVTEMMFRPDGTVSFVLRPTRRQARHPLPGGAGDWSFYHLSVRFPGPDGARFTVRLRPA